jgi:hypothetical protein
MHLRVEGEAVSLQALDEMDLPERAVEVKLVAM